MEAASRRLEEPGTSTMVGRIPGSGNSRCKDLCGCKMCDNPEHPVAGGEVAEASGSQVTGAVRPGEEIGFYRGAMRSPGSISGEEITF